MPPQAMAHESSMVHHDPALPRPRLRTRAWNLKMKISPRLKIAQIVEAGDAGEDGNEIPYESLLRIVQCEESTFTAAIFGRVLARLEDLNEAMLRGGVVHLI